MERVLPAAEQVFARSGEPTVGIALGVLNGVTDAIVVLVMALDLLLDGARFGAASLRIVPLRHRSRVRAIETEIVRVFGAYLRGQLVLAVSVGVLVTLSLTLLGMPSPVALGVFAAVAESRSGMTRVIATCALTGCCDACRVVLRDQLNMEEFKRDDCDDECTLTCRALAPTAAVLKTVSGARLFDPRRPDQPDRAARTSPVASVPASSGKANPIRLPVPTTLSAHTRPPCASTMSRAM